MNRRWNEPRCALLILGGVLMIAAVLALVVGPVSLRPQVLWWAFTGQNDRLVSFETAILWQIRVPRLLGAIGVGAALGLCGAAMQGLFRNPLADPGLIGVTGGAALGSVLYLKFGAALLAASSTVLASFGLPLAAFLGGLGMTLLIYRASFVEGQAIVGLMLLAGVALNAFAGAMTGLVLFFADDQQMRDFTFWTLGSVGRVTDERLYVAGPIILFALFYLPRQALALNALLLGEAEAGHLGFDLAKMQRRIVWVSAAGVGAAVSLAGGIGFLGLIAPHLVRQWIGPDHRWLMPASAILGAALLLVADLFARVAAAPAELPVGVVMAAIGAPVFYSLLRGRRRSALAR
jgi:iron complex transport system permease protein